MKQIVYLLAFVFAFAACDDDSLPEVKPAASGTCTIGELTYEWVRIGNREWITSNLKNGDPYYDMDIDMSRYSSDSAPKNLLYKEDDGVDYERYGNLYEWETACKVCEELEDGWRLPSDEDWQDLERALGMGSGEAASDGWRGSGVADLLRQGEEGTGLAFQMSGNASFGGRNYDLMVAYVKEKAYFWSSTRNEDGTVYYRKLHYNSDEVYRGTTNPRSVPMMR
ncbi:MAG: fibrobacter succinogenes major paralogous domain-containing protein, partial [Odoribacter sp.]|nr:fibrobacter succinogenes major paralogous domain-containing protein [Odoribacter sp.]